MDFLFYCLIGIAAGFLAGKLMKGKGFGLIVNLIVGIIGGILGGWLFGVLGLKLPFDALIGSLITATAGACVLLFLLRIFK